MWKCEKAALLLLVMTGTAMADIRFDPDAYRPLAGDRRAHEVGDVLTVIVIESTTAESAAGTGVDSATDIKASAGNQRSQYSASMAVSGDSSGSGQTTRRGAVRTRVGVRVTEKVGGLLRVVGEQTVTVNDEKQQIRIAGLVRPDDILGDNTVYSSRLAQADIEISGRGVVNQAQKPNVVFRILKWLRLL